MAVPVARPGLFSGDFSAAATPLRKQPAANRSSAKSGSRAAIGGAAASWHRPSRNNPGKHSSLRFVPSLFSGFCFLRARVRFLSLPPRFLLRSLFVGHLTRVSDPPFPTIADDRQHTATRRAPKSRFNRVFPLFLPGRSSLRDDDVRRLSLSSRSSRDPPRS